MQNIQHNKDERTHFFRKIYLSFYRNGCVWEGVGDRTKTATYWTPNSSGYHRLSFPFSWAAQPGAWGPSRYWDMVLIPASSLQLIWTSCHRGHITIWRPPTSCARHNSHSIQPLDSQIHPLLSSTGCTCYLHRWISSFDSLAGVNIQHISLWNLLNYSLDVCIQLLFFTFVFDVLFVLIGHILQWLLPAVVVCLSLHFLLYILSPRVDAFAKS